MVTDNGHRLATESLRVISGDAHGASPQLLFVIDTVNTSFLDVARSEDAVEAFLRQGSGQLRQPTSIIVLSDTEAQSKTQGPPQTNTTSALHQRQLFVHRIPASQDGNTLAKALVDYKTGLNRILESQGGTGASERVRLSLEALSFIARAEAAVPGVKLTVWLSPGWPFLGRSDAKSSERFFDSVIYFSDLIRTARMVIYSVSPAGLTNQSNSAQTEAFYLASRPGSIQAAGRAPDVPAEFSDDYYKEFLKGVRTADHSSPNDLALQVLASQSGGLALQQNNDLKTQIQRCAADVAGIITIAYIPPSSVSTDIYHEVEVRLRNPSQALRARTGFYTR